MHDRKTQVEWKRKLETQKTAIKCVGRKRLSKKLGDYIGKEIKKLFK
jgi:hypothetical protein